MKTTKLFFLLLTALFLSANVFAQPPGQNAANWQSVPELTDEFNGALNTTKWQFGHPWWVGRSPMLFGNGSNAYTQNGSLWLQTTVHNQNGQGNYLRGGAIFSRQGRLMKQGMYIESRYRASGLQIGTGFWLMHNDWQNDPQGLNRTDEIDIQEAFGGSQYRDLMHMNYHNFKPGNNAAQKDDRPQPNFHRLPNGQTVSGEHHTYGLWWVNANTIRYYFDGQMVKELRTNFTLQPMYVSLNSETYPHLTPYPSVADVNNQVTQISGTAARGEYKYIRCWKPGSSGGGNACSNAQISGLNVNKAGTTATLSFNNLSGANTYEVRAYIKGTYQGGTGGNFVWASGSSSPITINNLSASSQYTVVVRAICSAGGTSNLVTIDTNASNPPSGGGSGNQFYIVNRQTNLKIRPQTASDASSIIQVSNSNSGNFVRWERVDTSNGYFYLRNVETGKYFRPSTDADGALLEQRPTSYGGGYTQWKQVNTSNGYFYLQNRQTNKYFRPVGDGASSPMEQRPTSYSGSYTQWKFQNISARAANTWNVKGLTNDTDESVLVRAINGRKGNLDLNITSKDGGNIDVKIYNLLGKEVYSDAFNTPASNLTVRLEEGTLATGVYIAKIKVNNETKTIKFAL